MLLLYQVMFSVYIERILSSGELSSQIIHNYVQAVSRKVVNLVEQITFSLISAEVLFCLKLVFGANHAFLLTIRCVISKS